MKGLDYTGKAIDFDNLEPEKGYFAIEVKGDCMKSPHSPIYVCDGDIVAAYTIDISEAANYLDKMVVIQLKSGLFAIKHLCNIKDNSLYCNVITLLDGLKYPSKI